jgi:hypothetical protein
MALDRDSATSGNGCAENHRAHSHPESYRRSDLEAYGRVRRGALVMQRLSENKSPRLNRHLRGVFLLHIGLLQPPHSIDLVALLFQLLPLDFDLSQRLFLFAANLLDVVFLQFGNFGLLLLHLRRQFICKLGRVMSGSLLELSDGCNVS